MTYDGTLTFQYDYRNQIVKVKQGGTTVADYKYDALGRRVEKNDQSTVSRYIYSGFETVSVYDATTTWKQDFVFGQVIDEVLMLEQADVLDFDSDMNTSETTRSFYHRNALGTVMEITDMNEDEAVSYSYDPYGAVTITVGGTPQGSDPLGNPWMYTGRFHDEESGLEYYRARYYSTSIGRFLQRDPLGIAATASLYAYASSSPATRVDPLGLKDSPPTKARKAAYAAVKDAKYEMKYCTGDNYETALQCQECCGFAAWDAMAAMGDALANLAKDCAKEYPDDKKRAEELGVDADDEIEGLEDLEHVEEAAEFIGAILEAATASHVGAGIAAGASAGYHVAGAGVALKGARALAKTLAKRNKLQAEWAGNKYVKCMKSGSKDVSAAMGRLEAAYNGCMDKCRKKWGKSCGITKKNKKAWNWLRDNDDYRLTDD
jgi:RHS repeat-associated protein